MDEQVALIEHACAVFEVRSKLLLDLNVNTAKQSSFQHTGPTRVFCLQNPSNQTAHQEASATLLAFRNSAAPIGVCQHVLQSSSSEQAKFQVGRATSSFREPAISHAYPIRVTDSCSYMLCRLQSLCGMQLYASGQPWQEMISMLCGHMFYTMYSGLTAYCTFACPNLCHAMQISWAAQTLLMLLVLTVTAVASAAYLSAMLLTHMCTNVSIPVCFQHIHAADRHTPGQPGITFGFSFS